MERWQRRRCWPTPNEQPARGISSQMAVGPQRYQTAGAQACAEVPCVDRNTGFDAHDPSMSLHGVANTVGSEVAGVVVQAGLIAGRGTPPSTSSDPSCCCAAVSSWSRATAGSGLPQPGCGRRGGARAERRRQNDELRRRCANHDDGVISSCGAGPRSGWTDRPTSTCVSSAHAAPARRTDRRPLPPNCGCSFNVEVVLRGYRIPRL